MVEWLTLLTSPFFVKKVFKKSCPAKMCVSIMIKTMLKSRINGVYAVIIKLTKLVFFFFN